MSLMQPIAIQFIQRQYPGICSDNVCIQITYFVNKSREACNNKSTFIFNYQYYLFR